MSENKKQIPKMLTPEGFVNPVFIKRMDKIYYERRKEGLPDLPVGNVARMAQKSFEEDGYDE